MVYPCTCLEFLGITIDSQPMEFRLHEEKWSNICLSMKKFLLLKKITHRELQSLLGMLFFAAGVIPVGRFCKMFVYGD